jgi:hypothetical protein
MQPTAETSRRRNRRHRTCSSECGSLAKILPCVRQQLVARLSSFSPEAFFLSPQDNCRDSPVVTEPCNASGVPPRSGFSPEAFFLRPQDNCRDSPVVTEPCNASGVPPRRGFSPEAFFLSPQANCRDSPVVTEPCNASGVPPRSRAAVSTAVRYWTCSQFTPPHPAPSGYMIP